MKKNALKIATVVSMAAALAAMFFLPVPFTIYENGQDAGLKPYGEILPGNPLNQCATGIGDYGRYGEIRLEPYLATYGRVNTSHYTFTAFVVDAGQKFVLHREIFSAADVADNEYRPFSFNAMSRIPGRLCFTLETSDAFGGNAITAWLSGDSSPVYRIAAYAPLGEVTARLTADGYFGLGREALFGLFFACLFAYLWLVVYLAGIVLEQKYGGKKIPKPAHNQRAG